MKSVSLFSAALLLVAAGAYAQDRGQAGQSAPPTEPSAQAPYGTPPSGTPPATAKEASSSKTISGTVESLTEGKTMKIKTAEGKTKSFSLRDAAIDPSVKVGSAVKVTQSRDVNGKSSLTVEPDQGDKH
jgi:ABC-type oligopeptide transport system substrate-binding subunit